MSAVSSCVLLTALSVVAGAPAAAEPYTPAHDDIVLTAVPRSEIAQRAMITSLSQALDAAPARGDIAARLAQIYLDLHTQVGDPRYLGYADAAIAGLPAHSAELRLIRARLLQARHDFAGARDVLERLIGSNPDEPRAWAMLAAITLIQGDYAVTRNACARLSLLGRTLEAMTCGAEVASLTGRSRQAFEQLTATLADARGQPPQLLSWGHLVVAGIARRLDDNEAARQHFQTALDLKTSVFAAVSLADVLIDQGRAREALAVLEDRPAANGIILRRAIAARMLGRGDDESTQAAHRIEALKQRGDERHAREVALYALLVADQPGAALMAAQRNWSLQRESLDARLLLLAARAADEPDAALPVTRWMEQNNSDDLQLKRIASELEPS